MEDFEVQLFRPPVTVGHASGGGGSIRANLRAHDWTFAGIIHGFICFGLRRALLRSGGDNRGQHQRGEQDLEFGWFHNERSGWIDLFADGDAIERINTTDHPPMHPMHCLDACHARNTSLHFQQMRNYFELQSLEQFVVLARTRNFTKAAAELNLSQSALSRAIQKLEEQLGSPLFDRKPREVMLTDLGELMMERAKAILKLMDDTFAEIAEASRRGRIRLGAIPTIAPYLLPSLLSSFAKKHPDISVMVQEDTTDMLIKSCSIGEIELAIVALPIIAKDLEVEALFSEQLQLVLPVGHPLAKQKTVKVEAVDQYPFVMLNEAHCLAENIATFCRGQSIQPVTVERTSQLTTVQELVSLDHGVSIIPEMARKIDTSDQRVYRSFSGAKPTRTIALMWNPSRHRSEAVKALMEHVRSRC